MMLLSTYVFDFLFFRRIAVGAFEGATLLSQT